MARARRSLALLFGIVCTAAGTAEAVTVRRVNLVTNDLVFNPVDGFLYASVPAIAPEHPNSVLRIDPRTGAVGPSVEVGDDPNRLAIADDGISLYVGVDGPGEVRHVNLATMTAGAHIGLGPSPGLLRAEDIEVQPGQPHVIAVALRNGLTPHHAGVAIFADGVQRPVQTPGHTGSNVIVFGALPGRLYGYNNESSEHGFRRMTVSASGVVIDDVTTNLLDDFTPDLAEFGGRVYSGTGEVVDGEARTPIGSFALPVFPSVTPPVAGPDRVHFVNNAFFSTARIVLSVFDAASRSLIQRYEIPGASGQPASLRRLPNDGLAFRTLNPPAVMFLERAGQPPTCDISLRMSDAPDPVEPNQPLEYRLRIANQGDIAADHVFLRDRLPAGFQFTGFQAPRGFCYDSLGTIVCDFGPFSPADSLEVSLRVTPANPGTFENRVTVFSLTHDSDPANNEAVEQTVVRSAAPPAEAQLAGLRETVLELGLHWGPTHQLLRPIEDALDALAAGDTRTVCAAMVRFVERVHQREGHARGQDAKLTPAQAADLRRGAGLVSEALGCLTAAGPDRRPLAGPLTPRHAEERFDEGAGMLPARLALVMRQVGSRLSLEVAMPSAGPARLEVLDVQGRIVATLFDGTLAAGVRGFEWNDAGGIASGLYFCRLMALGERRVVKAPLLR